MRYAINRTKFLSEDEISILAPKLNTIGAETDPLEERNKILISLLLHTGARATELLNCTINDLNLTEGVLLLRGIKGSNDREIPLATGLLERLKAILANRSKVDANAILSGPEVNTKGSEAPRAEAEVSPKDERLFPITYWRLRQIWNALRPGSKSVHCLRHTFAIQLYKRTRDLRLVQVALGHRSINNTIVYADYVFQTDELRKGILG